MPARSCVWWAPGRVNVIGEHTDYNGGFALPFALDRGCTAIVTITDRADLVVTSRQRADRIAVPLERLDDGRSTWAAYAIGAVWALAGPGVRLPGLDVAVDSDAPVGAGLASSAAVVCSVAAATNDLLGLALDSEELLSATRRAENDFVGAPTGGLDQLAALRCTAGHALLCDMRSLASRQVAFDLPSAGLAVLVIDTRSAHRHATGEYRARRAACDDAARLLGVDALRDVEVTRLDNALDRLPDDSLRRAVRHVVTENDRVLRAVELLDRADVAAIGPLLTASHRSLREDYRVTTPELDVAVDTALGTGALGARMTGGGFGGSVIALVVAEQAEECANAVTEAFARRGFPTPTAFRAAPAAGVRSVAAE